MDVTNDNKEFLREKLGEIIPSDGDESTSFFTDAKIVKILTRAKTMNAAAWTL